MTQNGIESDYALIFDSIALKVLVIMNYEVDLSLLSSKHVYDIIRAKKSHVCNLGES